MGWYTTPDGSKIEGPFEDEVIVAYIMKGARSFRICEVGSKQWQDPAAYPPFANALRQAAPPPPPTATSQGDALGTIMALVPILAGMGIVFFGSAGLFIVFVVIMSTILVAVDAPRWHLPVISHTVGMFLLWLVVFPAHFYGRGRAGAKHGASTAIASMMILALCVFVQGWLIPPILRW